MNSSTGLNSTADVNSTVDVNATVQESAPQPYMYFTTKELDIGLGVLYLFFGLFGIYSNGSVLWLFYSIRKTVKVHPFTLCAMVLATTDLLMCTLGVSPYAILILAGRPVPSTFPPFLCKIFGFVNNFCDRFAWFNITSIMVFRCITMIFPLKLRNFTYRPFIYILSTLALLQGVICMLPFFNLEMIHKGYEYSPNMGECVFSFESTLAPGMTVLIDVLWWGPFLACVLSCVLFFFFIQLHTSKVTATKSEKGGDAKKKTAVLTTFFIVCYLPKVLLTLFDFLISSNKWITWEALANLMGQREALILYVYMCMVSKGVIPAGRAAFTPTMLRLKTFLQMCNSRRRKNETKQSFFSSSISLIKDKFSHDNKNKQDKLSKIREEQSQLV